MNQKGQTVTLSPEQFDELPRCTVQAEVPHSDGTARYEGVLLAKILEQVGVRTQEDSSREGKMALGAQQSAYVLVEAEDGYQVVFSDSGSSQSRPGPPGTPRQSDRRQAAESQGCPLSNPGDRRQGTRALDPASKTDSTAARQQFAIHCSNTGLHQADGTHYHCWSRLPSWAPARAIRT